MTKSRHMRNIDARSEAKSRGEKYYFSWIPCKHGHNGKRQTSNGSCIECVALKKQNADRNHYKKNSEKIKKKVSEYRQRNRTKVAAMDREKWLRNHKENLEKAKVRTKKHSEKKKMLRHFEHFMSQMESDHADAS